MFFIGMIICIKLLIQIPVIEPTVDDIIKLTREEDERARKLEEEKRREQ